MYLDTQSHNEHKGFCTLKSDKSLRTLTSDYNLTDKINIQLLYINPNINLKDRIILTIKLDSCTITEDHGECKEAKGFDIGVLISRLPYKESNSYLLNEPYNEQKLVLDYKSAEYLCEFNRETQVTEGKPGNKDKAYFYLYRTVDKSIWKTWYTNSDNIDYERTGTYVVRNLRQPDCDFELAFDFIINTDLNVLTPTV
jgi:hypothetical protein